MTARWKWKQKWFGVSFSAFAIVSPSLPSLWCFFSAIPAILGNFRSDCPKYFWDQTRLVCIVLGGCYMHAVHVDLSAALDGYAGRPVVPVVSRQTWRPCHAYDVYVRYPKFDARYMRIKYMFIAVYFMAYSTYDPTSCCVLCCRCVSIFFSWFVCLARRLHHSS